MINSAQSLYTVHCLRASPDILPGHHNLQTRPLTAVKPEFVYTRLAWAISPRISFFLCGGRSPKRTIRLKTDSGIQTEIVDVAVKELKTLPRFQNPSPRKRSYDSYQGSWVNLSVYDFTGLTGAADLFDAWTRSQAIECKWTPQAT
jgi:hypothetical protein